MEKSLCFSRARETVSCLPAIAYVVLTGMASSYHVPWLTRTGVPPSPGKCPEIPNSFSMPPCVYLDLCDHLLVILVPLILCLLH